ncbi:hypothetical protein [Sphingomonas corticis]|uniref:Uncharacterized protein n=1 Tax=Sphingomonas corticis TaxID=2722791 RepID=A0ABX1CTD5_9SPHN|nr:hypothetical protein [Sphingomonas corticis]NJR80066.1 hypothetical protein [Sphingomonas corticis]
MSEATWGGAASPDIDWRMSAALENVPRGQEELAEVTSLEGAVRAWLALDPAHRGEAILTPERALTLDGASITHFRGDHIGVLAERMGGTGRSGATSDPHLDDAG